jgi:hypothetical protein
MLTALAAVITAVTGLLVVLRPGEVKEQPPPASSTSTPAPAAATGPTATATAGTMALPAGMDVKLAGGATAITILSARLQRR